MMMCIGSVSTPTRSLTKALKRSIRARRRAIKRELPFQGFDALERRKSFAADMDARGLHIHGYAVEVYGDRYAASICVPFRLATLAQDPAIRYMPTTGAP